VTPPQDAPSLERIFEPDLLREVSALLLVLAWRRIDAQHEQMASDAPEPIGPGQAADRLPEPG
jgi:hypothetical protein